MRMEQGVRTGLGHGGITCVLQTQFSSLTETSDFVKQIIFFKSCYSVFTMYFKRAART